jgi:hypothetical protein
LAPKKLLLPLVDPVVRQAAHRIDASKTDGSFLVPKQSGRILIPAGEQPLIVTMASRLFDAGTAVTDDDCYSGSDSGSEPESNLDNIGQLLLLLDS